MSWSGTVHCSWCYKKGHNAAGCPEKRDHYKKRLEDDPNDWRANDYFNKKKRSKKRTCTYCGFSGHNRKTCKEMKYAKGVAIKLTQTWRANLLNYLKRTGLGVGALVSYTDQWGTSYTCMVSRVLWERVDHRFASRLHSRVDFLGLLRLDKMNDMCKVSRWASIPLGAGKELVGEDYRPYYSVDVISRLVPSAVESQIPSGWLASHGCIENIFDKETTRWNVNDWAPLQNFYLEQ